MHLGSSGVLKPFKNVCENMLTLVHKVIHLVVLAHLQRRWCQTLGGFGAFGKMECLFSIAPDANSCGWHIGARVKKLEVKTS